MSVRPIDVRDGSAFADWFAVYDAAQRHDLAGGPWWRERELRVVYESSEYRQSALWVAEDGGTVIGAGALAMPLKDNPRLAEIEIAVLPSHRRRGVGSAVFTALDKHAADLGRSSLLAPVSGRAGVEVTPGTAFAERHGFTARNTEIRRVQRPPFQLDRLGELEREARHRAAGYRLETWRQRVPDDELGEYARLAGRMSTDAPLGDLDYEPELWDVDRVRLSEDRRARMGRNWWCTVAVADGGTLAGMTEIGLAADDDGNAFQGDTIVDSAHRGHRLGLLLKIANLRALVADRPGVQAIWTWNADTNRYMIAVNEKLGYVKAGWEAMYQRD